MAARPNTTVQTPVQAPLGVGFVCLAGAFGVAPTAVAMAAMYQRARLDAEAHVRSEAWHRRNLPGLN